MSGPWSRPIGVVAARRRGRPIASRRPTPRTSPRPDRAGRHRRPVRGAATRGASSEPSSSPAGSLRRGLRGAAYPAERRLVGANLADPRSTGLRDALLTRLRGCRPRPTVPAAVTLRGAGRVAVAVRVERIGPIEFEIAPPRRVKKPRSPSAVLILGFALAHPVGTVILMLPISSAAGTWTGADRRAVHVDLGRLRHGPRGRRHRRPTGAVRSGGDPGADPDRRFRLHDRLDAAAASCCRATNRACGTGSWPRRPPGSSELGERHDAAPADRPLHARGGGRRRRSRWRRLPAETGCRPGTGRVVGRVPLDLRLQQRRLRPDRRLPQPRRLRDATAGPRADGRADPPRRPGVRDRRGRRRPSAAGGGFALETRSCCCTTVRSSSSGPRRLAAFEWSNPATLGALPEIASAVRTRCSRPTTLSDRRLHRDRPTASPRPTLFVVMALMFIGGASGSTAGGIKVNTFSVLLVAIVSTARGRPSAEAFGRRIPHEIVYRALSVALLVDRLRLRRRAAASRSRAAPSFVAILFESISAFGTVGRIDGHHPGLPPLDAARPHPRDVRRAGSGRSRWCWRSPRGRGRSRPPGSRSIRIG